MDDPSSAKKKKKKGTNFFRYLSRKSSHSNSHSDDIDHDKILASDDNLVYCDVTTNVNGVDSDQSTKKSSSSHHGHEGRMSKIFKAVLFDTAMKKKMSSKKPKKVVSASAGSSPIPYDYPMNDYPRIEDSFNESMLLNSNFDKFADTKEFSNPDDRSSQILLSPKASPPFSPTTATTAPPASPMAAHTATTAPPASPIAARAATTAPPASPIAARAATTAPPGSPIAARAATTAPPASPTAALATTTALAATAPATTTPLAATAPAITAALAATAPATTTALAATAPAATTAAPPPAALSPLPATSSPPPATSSPTAATTPNQPAVLQTERKLPARMDSMKKKPPLPPYSRVESMKKKPIINPATGTTSDGIPSQVNKRKSRLLPLIIVLGLFVVLWTYYAAKATEPSEIDKNPYADVVTTGDEL